jgi:hypothetical protein
MKKKEDRQLVNPFSESFWPTWDLWKDFRKEEHNFTYKGVISEQMALKRLVTISEGDEEKAIRIVEQSISRGWMDFYELKQPNPNGKSKQSSAKKSAEPSKSLREQAAEEFARRNGGGGHEDDGTHLKAV